MKGRNKGHLTRSAAPLAIGLAMLSAPAMAQDAPVAGVSQDASPAPAPQEIIVTGSRIPQPNLESVSPITVVDAQEIKLSGTTRVEDLLNNLPQVFAGQASTLSNGSDGTATVDLRNLGPSRTLVLINGRRLLPGDPGSPPVGATPASGSAADLNAIPAALIKRVDVVTGGASATYGADAVAGVVNFIMDTEFTGVRLDGQYSFYQHGNRNTVVPPLLDAQAAAGRSGYGYPDSSVTDGGAIDATITFGAGFDDNRGHLTGYFGYRKIDPVVQSNRDYSACTVQNTRGGALQCGGSATSVPGNAVLYNGTTSTLYMPGPGRTLDNASTVYNFAPTNYFQRPDERYTGGFFAHYDISDAVKPYAEFMFMDDRSVAQIAPSGDFGNTLTLNCDNPMLSAQAIGVLCSPANVITGFLGNFPLAGQVNPGNAVDFIDPTTGATYNKGFFQLLRRNVEGGPRQADLQHTEYRGVVGVKGDLGPAWSYDAYYQYGRTIYAQTYLNEFSVQRLNRALDVVGDRSDPSTWQCRSARTGEDPSCVPYDIFGGPGSVTQAAVDYLSATGFQRGISSEQVASASITGQLGQYGIQTPWADRGVSIALGTEYRREAVELNVDQEFATGDLTGQGGATLPIKGSYYVVEGFGEIEVPIMHDSIFYDLSANAGYRYSSYKISNGNEFNTDTYKFGVEFAPIRDVRFRASYNRAVRVPNLQELFATQHVALDGSTDPCAALDRPLTAADVGCLAQGLRVGQTVQSNPAGQYNGLIGGVATLQPEKADTYSFGVVLQPRWVPGFSLSVDYFNIKLDDAIQGFGADSILATCTATADPTVCGLIHRNPVNGSLWLDPSGYVEDLAQNIGGIKTKGIDFNGNYTRRVDNIGTFSLSLVGTYLDSLTTDNGISAPYDCAGYYGVTCGVPSPKWRHKARLSYSSPNGIGVSVAWRYMGPVDVDYKNSSTTLAGPFFDFGSHIGSQSFFDLATNYTIGEHYTFRLGVNNIFDKQPPLVTSGNGSIGRSACPTGPCNGNTYPAVYDALGRYIYAGLTLDF